MKQCCLCDAKTSFVKAHAIPEAFFRKLRDEAKMPLLVADAKGHFRERSPIGVYDCEILCELCEAKFSPFDSYGIDVLLTQFDHYFHPQLNANKTVAFEGELVDANKLLEFVVSILWRASVSVHPFYKAVNLGPHEECAKSGLFAPIPSIPYSFDAVLSRWDDADDHIFPTTALLNPHRERWLGVNAYRLYLGKVVAYVKVDARPFPEPFAPFSLRAGSPCRVIARKLSISEDLKAMRKTVFAAERNRRYSNAKH